MLNDWSDREPAPKRGLNWRKIIWDTAWMLAFVLLATAFWRWYAGA